MTRSAFPDPAGSAGAAHFSGAGSLERAQRTEALRARAEGRAPRPVEGGGPPADVAEGPARFAAGEWPRPPSCLTASRLGAPPVGARVAVCGLVVVRQRPGSAKGVVFVTLEDETGVVNVIVWAKTFERHRREVIAGRLLRVTGRLQREGQVIHVVAERIEDLSDMLDRLTTLDAPFENAWAHGDEVRRPQPEGSRPPKATAGSRAQGLIRGAQSRAMHPRDQARRLFPGRPDPGGTGS